MLRSAALAAATVWGAACASSNSSRVELAADRACPAARPREALAFDPDSAAALAPPLVGTYELVTVTTTRGMESGPRRTPMRIVVTDSSERTKARGFGPDGRRLALWDQPLTAYIGPPTQSPGVQPAYVYRLRAGAFVQDERHLCFDCGATTFWLDAVGPSGLWGRSRSDLGGIAVQGRDGKLHASLEGRFCAYRVTADSSRAPGR